MNKKLSELSKPVATVDVQRGRQDGNIFAVAWSSAGHALPDGTHFTYSQEYVSALLAELEVKTQCITGLERHVKDIEATLIAATDEISDLEKERDEARAKLAAPVRLPQRYEISLYDDIDWEPDPNGDSFKCDEVINMLREQWFIVVEGDE